jgi:hypothetical protein
MKRPSAPTAARTALRSFLGMRRTLDGLDAASLARSYGVPATDALADLKAEQRRRG